MLQRATSNAYSWWWASHIRTKQSKWLEQSLQDMEQRVEAVLKLIQEDGDSFAKRAEMYYKKRPELIDFVEESYRAYRALASRYDHLSTELQNANHTIGTAFPDRVQFSIDDEDDYGPTKISKNAPQPSKSPNPLVGDLIPSPEKLQPKKSSKPGSVNNRTARNSGLSKSEAIEEISKLQKEALALQTVKEFVKSSYESGLNKLREIENQIRELQDRVFSLQDEFKVGNVVEYDKAWTSMAGAALKSCEEMLAQLQEKHERSAEQAKVECRRVEDAHEKLESFKHNFLPDEQADEFVKAGEKPERLTLEVDDVTRGREEPERNEALTMAEMAEKIDELVSKVIGLETEVSYQAALIDRLRKEIDDLLAQVLTLGDDKATLVDENKTLISRLKEMEEKLREIQDLNQNVENKNNHLQTQLNEACRSLDHLSEKQQSVKPDEEIEYQQEEGLEIQDYFPSPGDVSMSSTESKAVKSADKVGKHSQTADNAFSTETDQEQNWQEMLLNGIEDREKVLMTEYITILRSYKDVQKKLSDVGEKNQEVQLRELRSAVAKRDEEIMSLRRRLGLMEGSFDESKDLKEGNQPISVPNGGLEIETPPSKKEEEDVRLILIDQKQSISPIEEKLRMNIDLILDENLDFWLRFSTSFQQIGKFKTQFQDLQAEITEVKRKASQAGSAAADIKSDLSPVYKHLRDMQTELTLWIEQSTHLKEELQGRFLSLCNIQEEIKKALSEGAEEEQMKFTSHEATKLQGEVLNMKQENNKVREELLVGLNHVTALQQEIEKTFTMLRDEYALSEPQDNNNNNNNHQNQPQLRDSTNRTRVPLRAFIFGDKTKKKSIFSFMHHRRHHDSRGLDLQHIVS